MTNFRILYQLFGVKNVISVIRQTSTLMVEDTLRCSWYSTVSGLMNYTLLSQAKTSAPQQSTERLRLVHNGRWRYFWVVIIVSSSKIGFSWRYHIRNNFLPCCNISMLTNITQFTLFIPCIVDNQFKTLNQQNA